jgi:2-aminoadipate transaminase
VEVCQRARVPLIEDNPYGLLGFDHQTLPALRSMDDTVIYLGSFSKTFAPGTRVGWVVAPPALRDKLILAAEATMLCPSALAQTVVCTYLNECNWRQQITVYRDIYKERRDAVIETLTASMPEGVTWTVPQGGFYVWVSLPGGIDTALMLPRALNSRVAYVPGSAFYAGQARRLGESFLRVSYCFPPIESLREGVRRLAGVVNDELELRRILGPTQSRPQWRKADNPNVSMP